MLSPWRTTVIQAALDCLRARMGGLLQVLGPMLQGFLAGSGEGDWSVPRVAVVQPSHWPRSAALTPEGEEGMAHAGVGYRPASPIDIGGTE